MSQSRIVVAGNRAINLDQICYITDHSEPDREAFELYFAVSHAPPAGQTGNAFSLERGRLASLYLSDEAAAEFRYALRGLGLVFPSPVKQEVEAPGVADDDGPPARDPAGVE